jgi:hypothetical protein
MHPYDRQIAAWGLFYPIGSNGSRHVPCDSSRAMTMTASFAG